MPPGARITLSTLQRMKQERRPIAMLTAYDYPTAVAAGAAGVHSLLIGDSMGSVLLGRPNTRATPLALMLILGEAVRRGAPDVFLVGDIPYESIAAGEEAVVTAAERFRDECGCDAVKVEVAETDESVVKRLSERGIATIAHLGLRPQSVLTPDGYRAQARDEDAIRDLADAAARMEAAGAALILLEAVPPEASQAVVAAVRAPVIGCGAGPACDGHVVVTQDMLGVGQGKPPRFVPVLAQLGAAMEDAMRQYVRDVQERRYPAPQHTYAMKGKAASSPT